MRHPYTTNAQRLSSAQTMLDRATDDRTDFSDWYESDHYALWLSDMTDDLIANRSCFGFDRGDLPRAVQDITLNADYDSLSDEWKAAVDGLTEYMDAHLFANKSQLLSDSKVADILKEKMYEAWRPIAKQMAEEKAEAYYWQEVAK